MQMIGPSYENARGLFQRFMQSNPLCFVIGVVFIESSVLTSHILQDKLFLNLQISGKN